MFTRTSRPFLFPHWKLISPATRALFVHLEANVHSHGIIHDPVNINKCISSLYPGISIFLSLSLSPARGNPLLFPLRRGDARALMHAFTRACYSRERLVRTHARVHAHARTRIWHTRGK
ncbi:hypothetical protein PUN28_020160 [Cardiocondyla obscurior]|uniref:Uncharacterized protein n=1 Tax=Cardiocondyla obscurior TaxID=286306 RepID=A0AAW2EAW1_9HYME